MNESTKKLIVDGAPNALMGIFSDSVNPLQFSQEVFVFTVEHDKILQKDRYQGRPVFDLLVGTASPSPSDGAPEDGSYEETIQFYLDRVSEARHEVSAHYSEEDAVLYSEYIVDCLECVAAAAGGGLFGTEGEVSDDEKAYIEKIKGLLGVN